MVVMAESLWERLEPHLAHVQSPSQYIGGEWNAVVKDWDSVRAHVCFAFPDAYTIGMSHLGLQIFYGMINERPDALCERAFAPWPDLEARMRAHGIPLFTVDTHRPVRAFDIVGFSLQAELSYTNIVNMLDLAGIPIRAAERGEDMPIVVGGGPNASYPEPVAEFFDVFIVGDGEETFMAFLDLWLEMRRQGASRADIVREAARRVPGAYVPSLYDVEYGEDGWIRAIRPREGAPAVIHKALTKDFEGAYFPVKPVVPYAETVFGRIQLEIMRGCPHKCRFCHAVNFKNALRFRSVETLLRQAEESYRNTGSDEIALSSLSSGDYPHIQELLARLNARFAPLHVSVSLPSLRIDHRLAELPRLMKAVRKSGFTVAPEGGTEEFRKVIRKPIEDEDLFAAARAAFEEGWRHIKLYFMMGLPCERDDDLLGIVRTARAVSRIGREVRGRPTDVHVTVSPLVPKPHTPYQFVAQREGAYFEEKAAMLRAAARGSRVRLKIHNWRQSHIEAALARGDRRVADVIVEAWRRGCRFDEWSEHFEYERWLSAFEECGTSPDFWARREITDLATPLPWDHIHVAVTKDYLWRDLMLSYETDRKRA
jgi:radical SAM family uncharacterized protein